MPTRTHLTEVARQLKKDLNGSAFVTVDRMEITRRLRLVSGEPTTRIKKLLAEQLTDALAAQGVLVFPPLGQTSTHDTIRLYHAGSLLGQIIDIVVHPDPSTDKELGGVLLKVKGQWKWATEAGPAPTTREAPPAAA
jgi:hypothetical protein